MGQAISAARASIKIADEEAASKAKQDLDVLQKAVDSQLNEFESLLDAKFLNPTATQKTEVPGIRALRKMRFSNVQTTDGVNQDVAGAIDSFFSIGSPGVDTKSAVMGGFKKIVTGALDAFMGKTDVGQHTEKKYFIFMDHNAVVRLDVLLWRWNFSGKGFSTNIQNAMGYVVCTSVVDIAVLKTSEFVYLISEYAGDEEGEATKYIKKMENIYDQARKMRLSQNNAERRGVLDGPADTDRGNFD